MTQQSNQNTQITQLAESFRSFLSEAIAEGVRSTMTSVSQIPQEPKGAVIVTKRVTSPSGESDEFLSVREPDHYAWTTNAQDATCFHAREEAFDVVKFLSGVSEFGPFGPSRPETPGAPRMVDVRTLEILGLRKALPGGDINGE